MSALTSAKINGASYLTFRFPSLMAVTGHGPQRNSSEERRFIQFDFQANSNTFNFQRADTPENRSDNQTKVRKYKCTFAQFLRGGVQNLPAVVSFGEVVSPHPGLHPAVEVPTITRRGDDEYFIILHDASSSIRLCFRLGSHHLLSLP